MTDFLASFSEIYAGKMGKKENLNHKTRQCLEKKVCASVIKVYIYIK